MAYVFWRPEVLVIGRNMHWWNSVELRTDPAPENQLNPSIIYRPRATLLGSQTCLCCSDWGCCAWWNVAIENPGRGFLTQGIAILPWTFKGCSWKCCCLSICFWLNSVCFRLGLWDIPRPRNDILVERELLTCLYLDWVPWLEAEIFAMVFASILFCRYFTIFRFVNRNDRYNSY